MMPVGLFGHPAADRRARSSQPKNLHPDSHGKPGRSRYFDFTRVVRSRVGSVRRSSNEQRAPQPSQSPRPPADILTFPVDIPPEYASLKYSCTAYNTYKSRPRDAPPDLVASADLSSSDPPTNRISCPQLSRFSWQARPYASTHLKPKQRHVEIVIPDWARPVTRPPSVEHLPLLTRTPSNSRPPSHPPTPVSLVSGFSFSNFPTPPSISPRFSIPPRTSSKRTVNVEPPQIRTKALRDVLYPRYYRRKPLPPINAPLPPTPPSSGTPSPTDDLDFFMATDSTSPASQVAPTTPNPAAGSAANSLSGLVCNVHRTTGAKPPALVGASTTVSGDKLYVFGGRRLSRRKTQLTADMYELDLISRHWTKLETAGTLPAPRYFHTVCALGDTQLVCYGGMASAAHARDQQQENSQNTDSQSEPGIIVMSDVHFYDIARASWTLISTPSSPPGRYAHCATILPSYSIFTSDSAPLSALRPGPSSASPSQGVTIDGKGGAEMVVVGGQDGASQYIEQISVFNLRSLTWTSTTDLGRSCGAYRSVVAPMTSLRASQVGAWAGGREPLEQDDEDEATDGHATLIYSNYNFLDVKLELQLRSPDGAVSEKPMKGVYMPPGLRFPHGEVIANHFVVSGTLITSNRQEYALWALDLRTLNWSRIDAGPGILNSGSWNRGLLWKKRNTFVVLGDRRRKLDEDYNHRRLNFSNVCSVELEAFGLYENPVLTPPSVGFGSASCPVGSLPDLPVLDRPAQSETAQTLGRSAAELREIADMDFLALGGERISVNFHIVARRWGPYLTQLLDGATKRPAANGAEDDDEERRNTVLANDYVSRNSSITITPGSVHSFSNTISSALDSISISDGSTAATSIVPPADAPASPYGPDYDYGSSPSLSPVHRSRLLFLPHTFMTIRALVYYLYNWTLPPPNTPLCTPQILCSLLQVARPYRVNGLLEATVERLHQSFDGKSTAAIFNAAAMAAGGGDALAFAGLAPDRRAGLPARTAARPPPVPPKNAAASSAPAADVPTDSEDELGVASMSSSATSLASLDAPQAGAHADGVGEIWTGEVSSVVGLQKRGLRGLMEGRAMRERMMGEDGGGGAAPAGGDKPAGGADDGAPSVGLGIGAS